MQGYLHISVHIIGHTFLYSLLFFFGYKFDLKQSHSVKKMGLCVLFESKKKKVHLTMKLSQLGYHKNNSGYYRSLFALIIML